jgi:NADH-quinone oxidoreductase subunit A
LKLFVLWPGPFFSHPRPAMTELVLLLLIFLAAGLTLLAANLVLGRLVRPEKPSPEKGEVYECGEQPIGTAWVQFDLRFYVVALVFVIFDVELAFFFPWAVVFGSANRAATSTDPATALAAAQNLQPVPTAATEVYPAAMHELAWLAFADILVFFGVLLVGFIYLWRRGDLEWVRSTAAQHDHRSPDAAAGTAVEIHHGASGRSV